MTLQFDEFAEIAQWLDRVTLRNFRLANSETFAAGKRAFYDITTVTNWPPEDALLVRRVRLRSQQRPRLPPNVRFVVCDDDFNEPVILPGRVQSVCFGLAFNHPVALPKSVRTAVFGRDFTHAINAPAGARTIIERNPPSLWLAVRFVIRVAFNTLAYKLSALSFRY